MRTPRNRGIRQAMRAGMRRRGHRRWLFVPVMRSNGSGHIQKQAENAPKLPAKSRFDGFRR